MFPALPVGIVQAQFWKDPRYISTQGDDFLNELGIIATGSLTSGTMVIKSTHKTVDLRGNVNTRMQNYTRQRLEWRYFAAAGLERINLKPQNYINLDDDSRSHKNNACCRHAERFVCSRCFISSK
jgi:hydroxymethylbilane synthase